MMNLTKRASDKRVSMRRRRLWALLLSFLYLPFPGVGPGSATASAALLGDVDGDGRVTVRDAIQLLDIVVCGRGPLGREWMLGDAWPVNRGANIIGIHWTPGDGQITREDVVQILKLAIGLRKPREYGPIIFDLAGSGPTHYLDVKKVFQKEPWKLRDGQGLEIYLSQPWDLAVSPEGRVYFTEFSGRVRVLESDGTVRTIAGSLSQGFQDGPGWKARFYGPEGIAILPDGSLVVADTYNHAIRKVRLDGEVTTLAGSGHPGRGDGMGREASFYLPNGIGSDPDGNVYVADTGNNLIRKITPDGEVLTIAGSGDYGFSNGKARNAKFLNPSDAKYDPLDGSLYVADSGNQMIRRLTAQGIVETVSGSGILGYADGDPICSQYFAPYSVDLDAKGNVWVADWENERIRKIGPDRKSSTVAGTNHAGYQDGPAYQALFQGLMSVRVGPNGWLYIANSDNQRIQALVP